MSFYEYFALGMLVLVIVVLAGFVYFYRQAENRYAPSKESKQADRSARKALRDAQL